MSIFEKNLMGNSKRNLKTTATIFSIVLIFGATSYAQSINDDLKPKETSAKPKPKAKMPVKTVPKIVPKTVKKTSSRSLKQPSITRNVLPKTIQPEAIVVSETSDQILNRFMNFQQSASVTNLDWNNVVAQTAKTLQSNPNHSVAKAQSLVAQGQIAYNDRNYAMAITHFKAVLQILPASSLPHYSLGKAYLANGQAKAAENSFKKATDLNENFALAYKGLGDACEAQGEKKRAAKYFRKATELSVRDGNMNP